uniref:Miranda n=1 Tax=Glossina morsitans morsitans TaxID=37546 RepID=A0A1B0G5B3_GLOMM
MSFSKAKLKRFNDIDVVACASPSRHAACLEGNSTTTGGISSSCVAHTERKEQIEKFFKDAVRFTSSSKEAKEFAVPKDGALKEDKKSKGLRLFRTPSLPHRLRFRQNSDITSAVSTTSTASSTPLASATTTPSKESSKTVGRLKGKEALHQEIRHKNDLIENYLSQIDVLKRHVEQLKEAESKIREEHANVEQKTERMIHELSDENKSHKEFNDRLVAENARYAENILKLENEIKKLNHEHLTQVEELKSLSEELKGKNYQLESDYAKQSEQSEKYVLKISQLTQEIKEACEHLSLSEERAQESFELIENLKNTNDTLIGDMKTLQRQIEQDALAYAQETKIIQNEMECLRNERNTLKNDLASKCDFIKSLQDELLDKNCEIDAHCDTIRQLCREKAKFVERERLLDSVEEKVRQAEVQVEQKVQKLESDLENALEREKAYWRAELDKRQKMAENELIKIELEKQDVMVLLESTNDMLRERDEKIQKYEDQLRNGIDYYVQLTDNLQKQVVDLKQDMAKTITEKYNYQLTLNNTRSTVNILMERLKKSDSDVEQLKAELESVQLAKRTLEQSYLQLQSDLERMRTQLSDSEEALSSLRDSSETLQKEVSLKESMFNEILTSEEETLVKFNKIASSFQERIEADAAKYLEMYNELRNKDETREMYMQDMKKALDEFATVLQFAQIELDSKENVLTKVRDECEQLKLENIALKSKVDDTVTTTATATTNSPGKKKENSTDLEKIEGLLNDSEFRAECDKITSWLLNSSADKCVRNESSNEINEMLKPSTPNNKATPPVRSHSAGKSNSQINTPRTPRTPRTPKSSTSHTPRTTPKKTVLFVGKENIPSPQKQVLKARNV